ncbi:hypothetical protein NF408_12095, partial [Streptococcus suis]|nr:hypothetical protein [Streptococcus suis]
MEIRKRGHQNCWLLKVAHQLTVTATAAKVLSSNSVLIFSRMEIRKRGHQNCWLLKVAHQLTVTATAAKVL